MNQDFWNKSYKDDPEQAGVEDFFIEQEAANLPVGTALDIGCGTGKIALALAARGWQVTGVDFAEEAIKLARETAAERGLEATFVVGDSATWEAPRQYDLVFSTFAMPSGDEMPLVVAGMAAALKPGGTLMISEWDPKMCAIWGFDEDELHSADAYIAALSGLEIEVAEIRLVPDAFPTDAGSQNTYVTFVRATMLAA